ncbi:hypothetical protein [Oscillibacter sp.]|uniref:hypothetical protein n=1 Tax=Oscillibacter sp. TaxID=1945593 RepID=UPI0028962F9D|nr:hypothetical protein [Oscillibacter sp.]
MENKISQINRIIAKHTAGEATLEETNADLRAFGSDLRLQPGKNALTAEEIAAAVVGAPGEVCGAGLLDTGTGTLDKVYVKDGRLVDNDVGEMHALLLIGGKVFRVEGDTLAE